MTRTQIAVAVAGVLLGAQVGIAALSDAPEAGAQRIDAVETQQITDAAPAEGVAADAQAEGAVAVAVPAVAAFVYPRAASDHEILPAQAEYLARIAVPQGPVIAAHFPKASDEQPLLPATVAYFDAKNAPAVAAAEPTIVAAAPSRE